MEQSKFEERFAKIQTMLKAGDNSYHLKDANDVWLNVGATDLDKLFTELSALYLDANNNQKLILYNYCGQQSVMLDNLFLYIRRIGKLILGPKDEKWFEYGIAGALLNGKRTDYRDIIISLVLLRFAADAHGINTQYWLAKYIRTAPEEMTAILKNVRRHPEDDIHCTVQEFGPPEWIAESVNIHGEDNATTFAMARIDEFKEAYPGKQNKVVEKKGWLQGFLDFFKRK